MSIASELTNLRTNISNAYDAINTKGGTMPANKNTANLATAIASIVSGFSPTAIGMTAAACGTIVNQYIIAHNLGVVPKIFMLYLDGFPDIPSAGSYIIGAIKIQTGETVSDSSNTLMKSGIYFAHAWGRNSSGNNQSGSRNYATTGYRSGNIYKITGSGSGTGCIFNEASTSTIHLVASSSMGSASDSLDPNATYKWIALG